MRNKAALWGLFCLNLLIFQRFSWCAPDPILDRSTLDVSITQHLTYADVFFTSNPSADWFDATPPDYAEHHGAIRIHAFLASPLIGGPYPAIVIGHGHHGHADVNLAQLVASLGYVALAIDGPGAGQSTGPPDENQTWISVDKGPQYSYLYHYTYAGRRALTLLEELAALPGNPYRIDTGRFAVIGASMGGILATQMNGLDDRLKAAVVIASAGNWAHTLRYPNSWLYHGIYDYTRDLPYNGSDPLNSVENIDTDTTVIDFLNYFDPIRYAPRQHAPILTIIGTHDEYFPMPCANLMETAITSAGTDANFQKRLWLLPNAPHQFDTSTNLFSLVDGIRQWLNFSFGRGDAPLAAPAIAQSGLRFVISLAEPSARLEGAQVSLFAADRIDTTASSITDFKQYKAARTADTFVVQIPEGERTAAGSLLTADNVIYYATAVDRSGLPVSSLMYKGGIPIDLSTDFAPIIRPYPDSLAAAPVPPPVSYASEQIVSSSPVPGGAAYQGMALTNPTDQPMVVKLQAYTPGGRIAEAEGLVNPAFLAVAPRQQKIFLAEEWLGEGARHLDGSFRAFWNDAKATSLAFRGNVAPPQLDGIGPIGPAAPVLWTPLPRATDPGALRKLRIFGGASAADVQVLFRGNGFSDRWTGAIPASGSAEISLAAAADVAEIRSSAPVSSRLEVVTSKDPWGIDAAPASTGGVYVQPHVELNGLFTTRVLVVNASGSAATVTLKLRSRAGEAIADNAVRTVPAGGAIEETAEALFGVSPSAPAATGWIEADAPAGVLVSALAADAGAGAAAASPFQAAASGTWSMPYFVENSGYYTGLALANPGDTSAAVTITAYDPSGATLGSVSATLSPHASATQLVSQWIRNLPLEARGQIVVSAEAPIGLLAYFGTDDGLSLAAIPFTH